MPLTSSSATLARSRAFFKRVKEHLTKEQCKALYKADSRERQGLAPTYEDLAIFDIVWEIAKGIRAMDKAEREGAL